VQQRWLHVPMSAFCACATLGEAPTPQIAQPLATSLLLAARSLRICWETNGGMHPTVLDQLIELSLQSGGCVKFYLTA